MVSSRVATAAAGLFASLAVSAALWYYFDSLLFFLFVPFVPFLFRRAGGVDTDRRPGAAECPVCGYRTVDPEHDYCPQDGTRLERGGSRGDRPG
ncbi:hypothetical protein BRC93_03975 [Halobacteriales archaeon QS_5_70_15]|nr:MAG: hypothetical protein BRC93_03975 [Halobacteriales archaeon QS_5_70_15]